ncbi:MAG: hypothetical protein WC509_02330 [Candidatus Izemoplasmatales bacterium]
MAKIKTLFNDFYTDRPRFFLTCFKFFLMFLFWIAFYIAAFTARTVTEPNRFNVADLAGVGSTFVLIWWILTLGFLALTLLKNDKGLKIVGILQIALAVIYLGMIMLIYANVAKELAGNPDVTLSYSFGFWLMLILLAAFVVSTFFGQLLEKLLVRVLPATLLNPVPAEAPAPIAEPEPEPMKEAVKEPVPDVPPPAPVAPEPEPEPEPVVEPIEAPASEPESEPAPVVEPTEVSAPAEPEPEEQPAQPVEPPKPES